MKFSPIIIYLHRTKFQIILSIAKITLLSKQLNHSKIIEVKLKLMVISRWIP